MVVSAEKAIKKDAADSIYMQINLYLHSTDILAKESTVVFLRSVKKINVKKMGLNYVVYSITRTRLFVEQIRWFYKLLGVLVEFIFDKCV